MAGAGSVDEPLLDQVKLGPGGCAGTGLVAARRGRPDGPAAVRCAGTVVPGLVIDVDATLVTCHSEKQDAAATYKHGFGYHPLLAWLDNTGEALAGMLRPGNANANTAADHISVTDEALAQIPDEHRYGTPILIRADGAGATKAWLTHLRSLREQRGLDVSILGRVQPHQPAEGRHRVCCRRQHGRSRSTPPANRARSMSRGCRWRRSPS